MSNYRTEEERKEFKLKVLYAAAKLFLEKGYSKSSTREIAELAEVNISSMKQFFGHKENILAELVTYVLERQFRKASELLQGKTDDKILYYAAETTLQLYIAESGENIRDLYGAAYSLPATTKVIQDAITGKLEVIFKEHLPYLESKSFYEREIASGSIMRGFMTIPCDRYFTMERKVTAFLESVLKIYDVPQEKIEEAIEFVFQFDYPQIAQDTVDSMLKYLEAKTE